MGKKFLSAMFAIIILTGIVLGIVSAPLSVNPTSLTFSPGTTSKTFTVTNNDQLNLLNISFGSLSILDENGNAVTFTITGNNTNINTTSTFTVTPTSPIDYSKFNIGQEYSGSLSVYETGNPTNNKSIQVFIEKTFCELGTQGQAYDLNTEVDIKNKGYGEEDNEWYPLDDIEIEITVENNGNDDLDDVTIEMCLYNPDTGKCIIDEGDMNLEDDQFNLKDGDDKTVLASFRLQPDDIDEDTDNYILLTKVFSDDLGEDVLCEEFSEDITIIREKHFVVLSNIEISETVQCEEELTINAEVWNIGQEDEQDVSVGIENKELGINEQIEIGDIDALNKEDLTYSFTIPANSAEKKYILRLTVYDEDDDVFENENDDKSISVNTFTVQGNCQTEVITKDAKISAVLETADEDVKPGNEIVIKATITNTGEETTSYIIGVDSNDIFSTVKSIVPSTITLDAGKSKDVLITLKLNEDASGEQIFNIKAAFNGKEVKQLVSLSIATTPSGIGGITGSAIGESLRENWFIWVIVLVNVILIIAIIIVAVRMSRA